MQSICIKCVNDEQLKALILSRNINSNCTICGASDLNVIDWNDHTFKKLFRALVRFYFAEVEYNEHWGGEKLETLFWSKNPIFDIINKNQDVCEEMLLDVLDPPYYPDYTTGISLYAGHDEEGGRNAPLKAIKDDFDSSLNRFQKKLETTNYFLLEDEARKLIEPYKDNLEKIVLSKTKLFRARLGYKRKALPMMSWGHDWHFEPYTEKDISAPPPLLASNGRMNRAGVSFLYLATDDHTAAAEIRPHPSHYVSIGEFECMRDIRIADFNSLSIGDFTDSDDHLDVFLLLKSIDRLFSMPIIPEERQKYSFTQFLAEVLRMLNFDGIGYRSSVGKGSNYTIFDPAFFQYVPDSGKIIQTKSLEYTYADIVRMNGDESDYIIIK